MQLHDYHILVFRKKDKGHQVRRRILIYTAVNSMPARKHSTVTLTQPILETDEDPLPLSETTPQANPTMGGTGPVERNLKPEIWTTSLTFRKLLASSARILSPASDTPLKARSKASLVEELARTAPGPDVGGLEELAEDGAWCSVAQSCSITASTVLPSLYEIKQTDLTFTQLRKRDQVQDHLGVRRIFCSSCRSRAHAC